MYCCPVDLVIKNPPQGKVRCTETTVTTNTYQDMLQLCALPQLSNGTIYQQDEATPQFSITVRKFLDE